MTAHDRALELLTLGRDDEHAAHVLQADAAVPDSMVGFHYQQASEKLLKALLAERNIDFPRTHDLVRLMELVEAAGYRLPVEQDELDTLTPFAATFRYEAEAGGRHLDRVRVETLVQQLREWVEGELR
jgi:HEPN domain-containing protein